ncbi:unnamed protein product [Rhizoctonia solani]|uniref:Ubiquitinyl hydrolase 1 n=1 Tax=Rhizoctonia solani TaxID=456999 RepID=A0A8H3H899_9AGAM|nr:unnamed protein product [Rhizoctonia solani]
MQLNDSELPANEEGAGRAKAIARRRVAFAVIGRVLPWLRIALFLAGIIWICCVPLAQMGRGTYIDENALQPGQVNTYWSWREVHAADRYLEDLEKLRDTNATSEQRASYFRAEFAKLGLLAATQPYTIYAPTGDIEGANAYSIYTAPRSSGSEAIVLSASWKSLKWDEDGSLNLRGVATILALAGYLKRYTLWAKDIVFVINDGHMDGMHAWLSAYHGFEHSNLETQPLSLLSGVIWTALCIDYPGHSFSHLGVYFEGLNGRLPNQDLLNSVLNIARYSNGVSVLAYDTLDHLRTDHPYDFGPWMRRLWTYVPLSAQKMLNDPNLKLFENRADIVSRGIAWQASGRASGVHGLFHQYRIDAVTVYARPSHGPHGFFVLGKIIESTTRTMNNLLERLHASFFFYLLTSAQSFVKIGGYLPAAVIMSVAMTFGGLALWVEAGWLQIPAAISEEDQKSEAANDDQNEPSKKWVKRSRPVVDAFALVGCTHFLGAAMLFAIGTKPSVQAFTDHPIGYLGSLSAITALVPFLLTQLPRLNSSPPENAAPLSIILKSFTLCLGGTITALLSLLNFSLAATTVLLLGAPLSYLPPVKSSKLRSLGAYCILMLLTPPAAGLGFWYFNDQVELRQANSTWGKQLRRPVPKGLTRGERLSRTAFATAATFSEWGWVGVEVNAAEDIGPQHRATACGFRKRICKNKHAPRANPPPTEPGAEDDVVVISSDDEPECSAKNCKANPNCCNHLGQRNWENEATARKSYLEAARLGDDPQATARNTGLPVGLKVWFQDIAFRAGVYSCVPELSLLPGKSVEDSPIYQLQMTFGALQHSNERAFNPVKLVECLGIRTGEQQDAQEFSKLFMSHLDNEFKKQENTSVHSLVTDQFEGRQVYGTRCATCQNASEHQSTLLEVEISLTSDCKLEDRLKANLEDEKLDGDNRYDCSTCGSKQDAFRYLRLTHLPPVLHFSVLRFVFDSKDFSRKKSKHAITFPHAIDMRPFLSEEGAEIWYDLRGVLLHRGPSAYHGHYEAQVFDVTRNAWFQFNDEDVQELKVEDLVGKQTNGTLRSQASKDAYMLIYAQRDAPSLDASTLSIPKHAFDAVQQLNKEYTDSCEAYALKKQELESAFSLLRERKREIYQTWHISDVDEISMVLGKLALEGWLSKELDKSTFSHSTEIVKPACAPSTSWRSSPSPPPADEIFRAQNTLGKNHDAQSDLDGATTHKADKIVCAHGLLDPAESANMKRISMGAWESIKKLGINATAIESNRICEDCTAALFNDWKLKRPKMHVNGCRDPIPDASRFRSDVYCEHDRLTPSQKFREKINTSALEVLKEAFPEFEPPDTETETCTICEAIATSDREASREARAKAEAEKTRLQGLIRREPKTLRLLHETYIIIPLSFVTQWRAWLAKPLTAPRPGPIINDEFICEHDGLSIDLAEEQELDGVVYTITATEWGILSQLYGGGPYIECSPEESDDYSGENKHQANRPLCQDCRKSRLSGYDHAQINVYRLADGESLPGANGTINQSAQPEKTQSTDAEVIHIEDTDNESPTLSDASPPARAPGNRKRQKPVKTYGHRRSKRIRTAAVAKKGTTFSIYVSRDDTIRDVKRKIQDVEDVAPFYQRLYLHSAELLDDTQTLSDVGFLRTDRLILRATEAMDEDEAVNWALTSGDVEPKAARPRDEGRAFGGTLLGSTYIAPAVATTPPEQLAPAAPSALAIDTISNPSPPRESGISEDQDMASVPSTISDGVMDLDSRLAQELAAEDAEASFQTLNDESGATGIPCSTCTYLNHPGLKYCEMCELELVR